MDTAPAWDLDTAFPGGVSGEAFREALSRLQRDTRRLSDVLSRLPDLADDPTGWRRHVTDMLEVVDRLEQVYAYAGCAFAVDTHSDSARQANAVAFALASELDAAIVPLLTTLDEADEDVLAALLADPASEEIAPWIHRERSAGRLRLPREQQVITTQMEQEALHGWAELYELLSGRLKEQVVLPERGTVELGITAIHALRAHPEESHRQAGFEAEQRAWSSIEDLCALALSNITGTRSKKLQRLGLEPLSESLIANRLQRETLEALWEGCDRQVQPLLSYLDRRASLLGKSKLDWWDLDAALPFGVRKTVSWREASTLVEESFAAFSPKLADFAHHAMHHGWVDARNHEGRRQGAFCAPLPIDHESRIFLTFNRSWKNTVTLAHELGHAFHNAVLFEEPIAHRFPTCATAETASTFAENLLRDAALDRATDDATRIVMLDHLLRASISFLLDIRARYAFELELYALRETGPLSAVDLCACMTRCQETAYHGRLRGWNPTFWASKLHFYITNESFYNWPYTFGYLFSNAVFEVAMQQGPSFFPKYREILRLTGSLTTEEIGERSLGVDLTNPAFWERSLAPMVRKVDQFLALTENYSPS